MSKQEEPQSKLELKTSPPSPPERGPGGEAASTARDARLTADKSKWHQHLKGFSAEMRRQPTPAENALWQALRNRQLAGAKFRRQHAIGRYIVDFISTDHKLIIEVDGGVHAEQSQAEYDTGRSTCLAELGYTVLRFSNEQVQHALQSVLEKIRQALITTE